MRRRVLWSIPWVVILLSFAILAIGYSSIPDPVTITRGLFGGSDVQAPKSLFTVFRVAMIELICAAAIVSMIRNEDEGSGAYGQMWTILLWTVAFKSLFQSLEIVFPGSAGFYLVATIAVVIIGIASAAVSAYKFFSSQSLPSLKLTRSHKALLALLLLLYIGFALVPAYIWS